MATFMSQLQPVSLDPRMSIYRIPPAPAERVTLDDPATKVMTDLRKVKLVTIALDDPIDFALQVMMQAEVRLLAVTDATDQVLGFVSAFDIMGERPINVSQRERIPRDGVQVQHVMTPRSAIHPLDMRDVERAHVRDVLLVLRAAGRHHILVVEQDPATEHYLLRGVFSATQIGRQLGISIEPEGTAQSFAELEQILYPAREVA